jgi:hypothetical protein
MEPSNKVLDAIRWMELELPKSQMPMIASRLEEIIDSIKMNGKSVEWANGVITEFRNTCPVAPKFWWQGGFEGQGRIPRHRLSSYNEPIAVTTAMDVAREEWVEIFKKARKFADKESRKRCWRVPLEIRTFPTRPEAATAARDFWHLYNRTREAKKAEFLSVRSRKNTTPWCSPPARKSAGIAPGIVISQAKGFSTSVRIVPLGNWNRVIWASRRSPSEAGFVRSAASSWARLRSSSPKQRSARHPRLQLNP